MTSKSHLMTLLISCSYQISEFLRLGSWITDNPKTRNIDIDHEASKIARKLFEMYSTGEYTLQSLVDYLKKVGIESRKRK